jgi:hypothetical protein
MWPPERESFSNQSKISLTPALSQGRGRSFSSVGQGPLASDFSQRGDHWFPLLGERVRVRASLVANCIVPPKHAPDCG